ncbi:hypothetical protein [Lapillicoccus jejuensis]|uniref:ATP/GTP-binding protein n=1 Tax=Lapillicoccus jejuensis TaxID=402171 RepID=A0A542E2T6_9MICO|nr:hypothetical protein [Lapillicoccus jejuensis]TQJ09640.1 hypothetical protein FB458_2753 [Lapillicoccus jejuensis]
MPRANRRRRDDAPLDTSRIGGVTSTERYAGTLFTVRRVSGATGASAERAYLCPGCQQDVLPGTPHVVAWPAEGVGGLGDRRHWHSGCWQRRDARPPGNAYR